MNMTRSHMLNIIKRTKETGNQATHTPTLKPYQVYDPEPQTLSPFLITSYEQTITYQNSRDCVPKKDLKHPREPGIHASGIVSILSRREVSASVSLEDEMPTRMEQGLAIEARYFGMPWHRNTVWQPKPLKLDGISGSPDGLTPIVCPMLSSKLVGVDKGKFRSWVLEEFKSTYYSQKKAKTWDDLLKNFRPWFHQQAMYLKMRGSEDKVEESGKNYISRLTAWWVNGDYSYSKDTKSPLITVFVIGWHRNQIDHFWDNRVLSVRDKAKHE